MKYVYELNVNDRIKIKTDSIDEFNLLVEKIKSDGSDFFGFEIDHKSLHMIIDMEDEE